MDEKYGGPRKSSHSRDPASQGIHLKWACNRIWSQLQAWGKFAPGSTNTSKTRFCDLMFCCSFQSLVCPLRYAERPLGHSSLSAVAILPAFDLRSLLKKGCVMCCTARPQLPDEPHLPVLSNQNLESSKTSSISRTVTEAGKAAKSHKTTHHFFQPHLCPLVCGAWDTSEPRDNHHMAPFLLTRAGCRMVFQRASFVFDVLG